MRLAKIFSLSFYIIFLLLKTSALCSGGEIMDFIRRAYSPTVQFEPPSSQDLKKAEDLFYKIFSSSFVDRDQEDWAKLGFQVEKTRNFLILTENEKTAKTGKGTYIFNTEKSIPIILEAPHYPSDKHTGTLAAQFMEEDPFLAGAWSSTHRKNTNLTAEPSSYFNAFSKAFGRAYPKGMILQFHGFDDNNEESKERSTDLIYSSTLSSPPPLFYTYGKCLKHLPFHVSLYPDEIKILGGTKNINAQKFREVTKEGLFLHLEMSLDLRNRLLKDKGLRTNFINCFIQK